MRLRRPLAALTLIVLAAGAGASPLGVAEARRQLVALVPRGQLLVTSHGAPDVHLHDLDGDGQPEVFALTVDTASGSPRSVEELSRYGRLFESEARDGEFRLLLCANREGTLVLARVVELGRWRVLASVGGHRIVRDADAPYALSCVFQTREGAEHVWVAVPVDLRQEPSRASFRQTVSRDVAVLDVDADGVQDIVTSERQVEPMERSETYLTWYRWSGREFREHASAVIVRTLERFLFETREQLLGGDFDGLVRDALEPAAVQRFRRAGLPSRQIVAKYFASAPDLETIRDVVLPDIRENPFRQPSETPPAVPLDIRLVDSSGTVSFGRIVVAIARNPFVRRPFTLLPAPEP